MQAGKSLNTSQVSGLLNISVGTLKRYGRVYNKHFSETARKHTHGRWWTPDDIEKVIYINRLGQAKIGSAKINQMLEDLASDPSLQQDEPMRVLDANELLMIAVTTLDEVKKEKYEIEKLINTARWNRTEYITFEKEIKREFKRVYKMLYDQNYFIQKVLAKLDYQKVRSPKFASWHKFSDRVDKFINEEILGDVDKFTNDN